MKALCAVAVAVLTALAAGADDKKDEKKDDKKPDFAKLILGKWEITKAGGAAPAGTTLEFSKDGKVKMVTKIGGDEDVADGKYAIEKDKLTLTMNFDGQESVEELTIRKLTDKSMELVDKDDGVDELKRLPGKGA